MNHKKRLAEANNLLQIAMGVATELVWHLSNDPDHGEIVDSALAFLNRVNRYSSDSSVRDRIPPSLH